MTLIDNGFIYNNYYLGGSGEKQYFSDENGKRIETMRTKIEEGKNCGKITDSMYYFPLCSLLVSADKVTNTASVYGTYLKKLKKIGTKTTDFRVCRIRNKQQSPPSLQ